ncbi:MAG: class I SAM-dependent methyltransferase [Calditrichaeota bacterium]|nr:MAG: class I SAM-dependent methyltransferase [Calditrichota bacterium]MBL1204602.1 class I SAM-dependent methyltransferase [Calditrichota bacterium]NOG44431.1 class I SAM-dependent methyltransferase [Calditrichota bacterium]
MNKYEIAYLFCESCSFIQTEDPYWLKESYESAINDSDTGIMNRNIYLSKITASLISFFFNKHGVFLDYAGGYGVFTRLMRDMGFDFYWSDPYCQNLLALGFEDEPTITKYDLLTSFETFEHLTDPLTEIQQMFEKTETVLFSTETFIKSPPKLKEWWYYGLDHGQHISIYSVQSLAKIANKINCSYYTNGKNIHLFSKQRLNPFYFKLACKLANKGIYKLGLKGLKNRAFDDMLLIRKNKIENI